MLHLSSKITVNGILLHLYYILQFPKYYTSYDFIFTKDDSLWSDLILNCKQTAKWNKHFSSQEVPLGISVKVVKKIDY